MNTFQKELSNLQHRQHLLYVLLFSFATIMVWIGIGLVTSQNRTAISAELQQLARPLNPTINTQILNEIKQKKGYTPSQLQNFPIYRIVTNRDGLEERLEITEPDPYAPTPVPRPSSTPSPTPTVTPAPTSSPSTTPSTQSASGSGTVGAPLGETQP